MQDKNWLFRLVYYLNTVLTIKITFSREITHSITVIQFWYARHTYARHIAQTIMHVQTE